MDRSLGWGAAAAASLVASFGCVEPSIVFSCERDEQCPPGWCEPEGYCSFSDEACPSGRRYGQYAEPELAEQCTVPSPPDIPRAPPASGPATTSTTASMPDATEFDASSTTGDASTGDVIPDPDPANCHAVYGEAKGYALCEETPTTCEFFAQTHGSCEALCSALGLPCITAFNDLQSDCERANETDCSSAQSSQICVCERPAP